MLLAPDITWWRKEQASKRRAAAPKESGIAPKAVAASAKRQPAPQP